jgi:hypothetical protein
VDLGGDRLPGAELRERLHELAREHLGAEATLRLTFRFETFQE